jgi:HEAT repeat protein
MDCCGDTDALIRRHATDALFKLRSGRAVRVLIDRLKDNREQLATRERAAAALAAVRSYSAIEGLRDLYSDEDEDPALRSYVAEELHRMRIR